MENVKNIWEVGTPFEDHEQIPCHVAGVLLANADINSIWQLSIDEINKFFFSDWDDLDESNPVWYDR